ncbi:esterase [Paenibacillus sp. Root52]|uniref:alpha/beta hydrolase n=1 Tax=Paenibacillus sp. Root52 TaxID=1736552 RepID=UPI0006F953BE|nr:alpha/beta hydrolase [Paenibacillus sp. Root52]KQY94740.1 esterase [Paenibacillus sp. Root52]
MNEEQQEMITQIRENPVDTDSGLKPSSSFSVQRQEVFIPTSVGETRVLIYTPEPDPGEPLPAFINMHGGGFIAGDAEGDDPWCPLIAHEARCVVINIDYRLAPEHKFPTAVHECYDVAVWVHEHPEEFGIHAEKLAIGGHSAGGNLAAAVCLLNKQRGDQLPIVLQILDYPPLDLHTDPALKPSFPEAIPAEVARMFNAMYLDNPADAQNPLASPVFAESLEGLPEALIITASKDSLAAEARDYADKLEQQGVKVHFKPYEDVPHGFTHHGDIAIAEDAWYLMCDKLKDAFSSVDPE